MNRKYHWTLKITPDHFFEKLNKAKNQGSTIKVTGNRIEIKKPKFIFAGTMPVYPQPFFVLTISSSVGRMEIDGKLNLHPSFYIITLSLYLMFSILIYIQSNSLTTLIYTAVPMGVLLSIYLIFVYAMQIKFFKNQTLSIIHLLESIEPKNIA